VTLADDIRNAVSRAVVRIGVRRRNATVTVASPLTVTLEADSTDVSAVTLDSYPPVVGDVVQVLLTPGALPLVLGTTTTTRLLADAILKETAAQSIPNNTVTAVTFSIEELDPSAGHSGSGNTWTAPRDGYYLITVSGAVVANAAGRCELRIRISGVDIAQAAQPNSTASAPHMGLTTGVQLFAGDTVAMVLLQNSGGALNTSTANGNPRMSIWFQDAA
jgi:hypothetical protein